MREAAEDTGFILKLALVVFIGQGLMMLVH
ncbi:hypothetical protein AFCDBAGC_5104 [Methylobacterium cerastii]|uniref:Uncharacterized protein n=1 Tax=Methylobacterium cerastii TaxID=932741 RepID=A0ABQ4QPJ7_9HYPH|nr:hypothetical protein AFCDBAGC_5104 [Methylobacterium cerastii]